MGLRGVLAPDDSVGGRLPLSAQEIGCQTKTQGGPYPAKRAVCVLPQIMPDVTSLRAPYMCAIHQCLLSLRVFL